MSWFLMDLVGGRIIFTGPFTEGDCQLYKRVMMDGFSAVCIERRMIDAKSPA